MIGEICYHDVISSATTLTVPSPPRYLTITRVFDDGIELNWIPPREPNGDIRHYIIKYTNGTQHEINTTNNTNCYNLTGLERGQTYNNIIVVAVNSAGGGGGSQPTTSYVHAPTVESTSELDLEIKDILNVGRKSTLYMSVHNLIVECVSELEFEVLEIFKGQKL